MLDRNLSPCLSLPGAQHCRPDTRHGKTKTTAPNGVPRGGKAENFMKSSSPMKKPNPPQQQEPRTDAPSARLSSWRLDGSMPHMVRQFSSFVVVGFIATAVHYAVLIGLVEMAGISAVAAALIGFSAGGVVSYSLNRRHVFHSNRRHETAAPRFTLVAVVGFCLTYVFMSIFVRGAGIPYLPAQVATTGIVMLWSFAAHRMWTFRADREQQ